MDLFKAKELENVSELYIKRFRNIYESIKEDEEGRKIWPLSKFYYGHGKYTVVNKDSSKKTYRAHRLAYLIYVGDIARLYNVDRSSISKIVNYLSYKHVE